VATKPNSKQTGRPRKTKGKKLATQRLITKAREIYVHGEANEDGELVYPTVAVISKRVKIGVQTIRNACAAENWQDDRRSYEEEYRRRRDGQLLEQKLQAIVAFDKYCFDAARSIQNHIVGFMQDKYREMEFVRAESEIVPPDETATQRKRRERDRFYNPFNGNTLSQLANTLAVTQKVGRLAVGESTENMNVTNDSPLLEEAARFLAELPVERAG
jgi:hypothetical protein